jgi:hypothetical protein
MRYFLEAAKKGPKTGIASLLVAALFSGACQSGGNTTHITQLPQRPAIPGAPSRLEQVADDSNNQTIKARVYPPIDHPDAIKDCAMRIQEDNSSTILKSIYATPDANGHSEYTFVGLINGKGYTLSVWFRNSSGEAGDVRVKTGLLP